VTTTAPTGVTVVLCAHNEQRLIGFQLEALVRQSPQVPWEVVVVDNGSTDDTASISEGFADRLNIRVLQLPAPHLCRARNTGVLAARYPLIAHCDADDEVSEQWLEATVDGLQKHALVTGPLDEDALNQANVWRPSPLPKDRLPRSNQHLPFAVGANIAYRRTVHSKIGGWNESYHSGGGDDVDFSWRAQYEGFEIGFCRDAIVRYRHRRSAWTFMRKFHGYGAADPLLFKHHAAHGMRRFSGQEVGERWLEIFRSMPAAVADKHKRAEWLATLSWSTGRISGSVRNWTMYL
jgi:glycosyltransferase involved in cell wall biosynthesis